MENSHFVNGKATVSLRNNVELIPTNNSQSAVAKVRSLKQNNIWFNFFFKWIRGILSD